MKKIMQIMLTISLVFGLTFSRPQEVKATGLAIIPIAEFIAAVVGFVVVGSGVLINSSNSTINKVVDDYVTGVKGNISHRIDQISAMYTAVMAGANVVLSNDLVTDIVNEIAVPLYNDNIDGIANYVTAVQSITLKVSTQTSEYITYVVGSGGWSMYFGGVFDNPTEYNSTVQVSHGKTIVVSPGASGSFSNTLTTMTVGAYNAWTTTMDLPVKSWYNDASVIHVLRTSSTSPATSSGKDIASYVNYSPILDVGSVVLAATAALTLPIAIDAGTYAPGNNGWNGDMDGLDVKIKNATIASGLAWLVGKNAKNIRDANLDAINLPDIPGDIDVPDSWFDNVLSKLTGIPGAIVTGLSGVLGGLTSVITGIPSAVASAFGSLFGSLFGWLADILAALSGLAAAIGLSIRAVLEWLLGAMVLTWTQLIDRVGTMFGTLGALIAGIETWLKALLLLLFQPSVSMILRFQNLYDALLLKMPLIATLAELGDSLIRMVRGGSMPPNWTITVPAILGIGTPTLQIMDFTFYDQYRSMIHGMIRLGAIFVFVIFTAPNRIKKILE